jgi:glycosyltransferase involved in cell wall biosynthesis
MRKIRLLNLKWNLMAGGRLQHFLQVGTNLNTEKYQIYNVCVVNQKNAPFLNRIQSVKNHVFHLKRKYDLSVIPRLAKFIEENKIDIVYSIENSSIFVMGLTKLVTKNPFKLIINTAGAPFHDTKLRQLYVRSFYLLNILIMNFLASKVVAVSQGEKRLLIQRGARGGKISVVYNGIDLSPYRKPEDPSILKSELDIQKELPIVGTVARLTPVKGLIYFLRSIPTVLAASPNTRFIIVGGGFLQKSLEEEANKLGIEKNVIFTGFRQDVPSLLKFFDIFVLPSLKEGLPFAIIEAMATAKPVIATDVKGNREVVEDGISGILVPPKNPQSLAKAIINLLQDKERAKKMGNEGFSRAEQIFSSEKFIQNLEDVIEDVFESA